MKKFGIRTDGTEQEIENTIIDHAKNFDQYTFLEIGTASGQTLKAVSDILSENHQKWRAIGVDIPDGWSLNMNDIKNQFGDTIDIQHHDTWFRGFTAMLEYPNWGKATLILKNSVDLLTRHWIEKVNFAFIDGCHGKPCVMKDFIAVEPHIEKGGIVMFHDAGEIEQGTDWQGHCNQNINVRAAITELGLFDNTRPGWKFLKMIVGDRVRGGWGNSCALFIKE